MDLIIFKKIATALLYPASLVLITAVLSVVFKVVKATKLSRLCYLACIVSFVLSTNPMLARYLAYSLEQHYPQQSMLDIKQHDAIVVLGGGLRIPTQPAKQTQLSSSSDRYWYAVQLYRAGKAKRIIISAGNVIEQKGLHAEGVYALTLLERWGVPSAAIIVEPDSRTTAENQQRVASILKSENINSALLVTSALHMPRAYGLFKELPISITPATADVLIRDIESIAALEWVPSANAMQLTTMALHEYYAIWYRRLKAFISKF